MGKSKIKDLVILIVLLSITIVGEIYAVFLFRDSFNAGGQTSLTYEEKSDLSYKVWLFDNNFYEVDYLGEEYSIIADAIDEIEIDFSYDLDFSDYVRGSNYYTINSKIVAYQKGDPNKKKVWDYSKMIKDKVITVYNTDTENVSVLDSVKIQYQKYKNMMKDYQSNYGVSLIGDLIIEIDIKNNFDYGNFNNNMDFNNRKMVLTIPLTDSVIDIDKKLIDNNSQTLIEKEESKINGLKLLLSLLAFALGLGLCVFMGITLAKLVGYDSKYDKELKKILRTYGSVIVNVKEFKLGAKEKAIYVDSMNELLDAQQELRNPILFYNIKPNKQALFALRYNNDVLIYNMSSNLYNDKKKK